MATKETLTKDTQDALIHCTIKHSCRNCPLFDYGETQLECKTKLLELLRDELLISKITSEDKE